MKITETIVTTVTTTVDLETMRPEHAVSVQAEGTVLPVSAVYAAVAGGLRSTLAAIETKAEGHPVEP